MKEIEISCADIPLTTKQEVCRSLKRAVRNVSVLVEAILNILFLQGNKDNNRLTYCHVYGVYATRIYVDSPDLTREFI
jgi:hypothetical protein